VDVIAAVVCAFIAGGAFGWLAANIRHDDTHGEHTRPVPDPRSDDTPPQGIDRTFIFDD
jgi:hypothetical protein